MHPAVRQASHKLRLALREVVALSPRTMAAIVDNSVRMSVHSLRAWRTDHSRGTPTDAGRFTGAATCDDGRGLAVTFQRATLHVSALAADVVRLAWGPGPAPYDVATRDSTLEAPAQVTVELDGARAALVAGNVRVEVDSRGVVVRDAAGRTRYEERTPVVDGRSRVLRRVLRDGERLCGLGEQARRLDLTGSSFRLWNRDPGGSWTSGQNPLYCSIPITVGLHPDGPVWAFHENTHDATVQVGTVGHAAHGATASFRDGSLVTYVAVGELDELLTGAALLLGRPAMPPRWALGYHHCRWGWRTDAVVTEVLEGFAARGIPLSALHLDIDHMDRFKVFTFDAERYGDVAGLARRAAALGARLVAIVDPAVRRERGFALYESGIAGNHFVRDASDDVVHGTVWPGWAAFPDFTSEATRAWWGSHYASLTSQGVAGAWHDMNEPTSIALWGDRTLPTTARHDMDGRGGDHAEAHNVYGLLMDRSGHEALADNALGARPYLLSRAGWAGLARYAWHWTADVEGDVDGLAQQPATFLGLGLSSVPFTGSDIGGFSGVPSPHLYLRWLELGVVSPMCRTHCSLGSPDREPWCFDAPVETSIARLIRLRYQLLPHLYRLAEEAHRLGHPILRPLDWPVAHARTGASARSDAMLLGDELLVVPVADPDARAVTLEVPAGRWRRLRLCDPLEGPRGREADVRGDATTTLDAPLGQPVILQRAGTVVVLDDAWDDEAATLGLGHAATCWSLHVVLDDDGAASGQGYDDAGDGDGSSRTDRYDAATEQGALVVTWDAAGEFVRDGPVALVVHGGGAWTTADCDGTDVAIERLADVTVVRLTGRFDALRLR